MTTSAAATPGSWASPQDEGPPHTEPRPSHVVDFDPSTMQAVLSGPYRVTSGLGRSAGPAGGRLLLTFAGAALTGATTKPGAADLDRFAPYLK